MASLHILELSALPKAIPDQINPQPISIPRPYWIGISEDLPPKILSFSYARNEQNHYLALFGTKELLEMAIKIGNGQEFLQVHNITVEESIELFKINAMNGLVYWKNNLIDSPEILS